MATRPKTKNAFLNDQNNRIFGLIAGYETVVGCLLAGMGEYIHSAGIRNYLIVDKETSEAEIISFYRALLNVKHVGVILIESEILQVINTIFPTRIKNLPLIVEIPSKARLPDLAEEVTV